MSKDRERRTERISVVQESVGGERLGGVGEGTSRTSGVCAEAAWAASRPLSAVATGITARLGVRRLPPLAGMDRWLELLSEAGTERAIVDGAADLQQQVSAASRPAHPL